MENQEAQEPDQTKLIPTIEKREETRWITFELNDKQILAKANKASALNTKIEDLNSQKKKAADNFKGKIQVATTELNDIFGIISSRTERKEVDCIVIYNYEERKIFATIDDVVKEEVEMSDYDFENRPDHIMPTGKETAEENDDVESASETKDVDTGKEAFFEDVPDSDAPPQTGESVKASAEQASKVQDEVNTAMGS